jgi:hypothetical protein
MLAPRRGDETVCFGRVGIAKNAGVINRINSVGAAREDISSSLISLIAGQSRGSSSESAEDDGNGKSGLCLGEHWRISLSVWQYKPDA